MSGFVFAFGSCFGCGDHFAFNAELVPSIVVSGRREPLCRSCVARANELRRMNGNPQIVVLKGAYDAIEAGGLP